MSRYETFDRSRLQLRSLEEHGCDLWEPQVADLATPEPPFNCDGLHQVALAIQEARQNSKPVVVMIGGHPIKLGLSRFLIDLMERGLVTHLATNGAGLIHDFELALHGGTSEDVAKWIKVGQFGLWQETGRLNDIVTEAASNDEGFGEGLGRFIETRKLPHRDISIAAAGWRRGVPVTSHVSIGSDIIHGYANCDGAALGKVTHTDFLILAKAIQNLEGGVFLNIGSAVTGPEVQWHFHDRKSFVGTDLDLERPSGLAGRWKHSSELRQEGHVQWIVHSSNRFRNSQERLVRTKGCRLPV